MVPGNILPVNFADKTFPGKFPLVNLPLFFQLSNRINIDIFVIFQINKISDYIVAKISEEKEIVDMFLSLFYMAK